MAELSLQMVTSSTFFLPTVITVCIYLIHKWRTSSNGKLPPCYSGWWPFIGCAIEFGKAPLIFIETYRQKVSAEYRIFCLYWNQVVKFGLGKLESKNLAADQSQYN